MIDAIGFCLELMGAERGGWISEVSWVKYGVLKITSDFGFLNGSDVKVGMESDFK